MVLLCGPIACPCYKAGRPIRSTNTLLLLLVVLACLALTLIIGATIRPQTVADSNSIVAENNPHNENDLKFPDASSFSEVSASKLSFNSESQAQYPQKRENAITKLHELLQNIYKDLKKTMHNDAVETNKPRKNIIIIAHGRSGSTITGDIFNQHPSVFYLYEPLKQVNAISRSKNPNAVYKDIESDVLTNVLRCRFSDEVAVRMQNFYNKRPNSSKAIEPLIASLCPYPRNDPKWDPAQCAPLKGHQLETLCRENYQINVFKILISRISENSIGNIMEACAHEDIECKFIFLVRDPRAIIASSRSVGLLHNDIKDKKDEGLEQYSTKSCQETTDNILFVKILPPQDQNRIMFTRYEDFAMNPLGALENLYSFASLESTEEIREWLYQRTHPNGQYNRSTKCKSVGFWLCTIDDASVAVNRWRIQVALEDVVIIEKNCLNAMKLAGYKPIEWSKELMLNTSIPLFKEKVIAKEWFSHENES